MMGVVLGGIILLLLFCAVLWLALWASGTGEEHTTPVETRQQDRWS